MPLILNFYGTVVSVRLTSHALLSNLKDWCAYAGSGRRAFLSCLSVKDDLTSNYYIFFTVCNMNML